MVFLLIVGACIAALFWKFWPRATRPGMVYQMKPRSCASVVDPLFLCFALLLVSCFVLLLVLLKVAFLVSYTLTFALLLVSCIILTPFCPFREEDQCKSTLLGEGHFGELRLCGGWHGTGELCSRCEAGVAQD